MKKRFTSKLAISLIILLAMLAFYVVACVPPDAGTGPARGNLKLKTITVDRGTFSYREGGSRNGYPVVMIHGWPENSYCWDAVAGDLNPSLRIIAPDLRGLGDSERTLDQSLYQKVELAKDIVAIVDALGISDFYLVGHDWGGVVAQEVALALPERVKKLAILNIHIIVNLVNNLAARDIIYDAGAVPFWYQYFQQQPHLPEAMIPGNEDVWVSHFFGDRPVPQKSINEYIRAYSIADTPTTAASLYRTMAQDGQRWYELFLAGTTFNMPLLYVYGNLDTVVIPEYLVGIEAFFPSAQIVEIESAHFVQEEKPAEVAQALNAFFQ
ncbi:alpha/beta fold hydrolase [Desulfatitalea alkaliphila]|uniref:Alpha/beta hydrolase n=1 Tax=Desulfatitalea alkaliphila TaxID=2929485 RepID=A0AA41R4E3_9BACT|nr:alpha/beta hydrolase [Desulfatitalea alkaliphila]MCJ8501471.1 alpha/beta hydrolase [Desulfatitalea alkaliphila]